MKYQFFFQFIFNFSLYYSSNYAIHDRLLIEVKTFLLEDEIFTKFKSDCEISHLFYCLETFYNLETAINFFAIKKEKTNTIEKKDSLNCLIIQKHIVHFSDLLQIRNEILEVISSVITIYKSEDILKKEVQLILQILSKKPIGPSHKDYLILLKKVLVKHLSKSKIFNSLAFDEVLLNILYILKENSFKLQSIKEVNDIDNYNKSENLDEFLSCLIELSLIFVWEKKDNKCKILKTIDFLLPKNLGPLTTQFLFEAIDKFKNMPAYFKLIEILFKRVEFIENDVAFLILQYIKLGLQNSEEALRYFAKKKILRFYTKSMLLQSKMSGSLLSDINDILIDYIIEGKTYSALLFYEYINYNKNIFFNRVIQRLIKSIQKYVGDKNLSSFYEKKERITIINNLIQFIYVIEDNLPNILNNNPQNIDLKSFIDCLFLIYEILKNTKLLYLTVPDIISFYNIFGESKDLWASISSPPNQFYYKNGGVLLSVTNIVWRLLKFLLKNKLLDLAYKIVRIVKSTYLLDKIPKTNTGKIKEVCNAIKPLIEDSNNRFHKFIIKYVENLSEYNGFLSNKKNENLLKHLENSNSRITENEFIFYNYLLYNILRLIKYANSNLETLILNEIFSVSSKILRFTGREFLLEIKNLQINPQNNFDQSYKTNYDKENFFKICNDFNEMKKSYPLSKSSSIKSKSDLINLGDKNVDFVIEFMAKFSGNNFIDVGTISCILNEFIPKMMVVFKKNILFVKKKHYFNKLIIF